MKLEPAQNASFEELLEPIGSLIHQLDLFMEQQVARFEPEVQSMVKCSLKYKGKRLRPLLLFYAGYGNPAAEAKLVKAAAVLELIHVASLVHDDILDEADIRRNEPTMANQFGQKQAVLLGDALFAHALLLSSEYDTPKVCQLVSQSTRNVCSGEILQTLNQKGRGYSIEDYFRVIELKTAELFAVSSYLGSFLTGNDEATNLAFANFGKSLGVAYQIYDDWIDLAGNQATTDKTLNTDLKTGKLTLPIFLLAKKKAPSFITQILQGQADPSNLLNDIYQNNIHQEVLAHFESHLQSASNYIQPFSDKLGVPCLLALQSILTQKMLDAVESSPFLS